MKTKLIELLKDFEDESIQERFKGDGYVPYDVYADKILDLFDEDKAQTLKSVDEHYNSDWINPLSIQDEIS